MNKDIEELNKKLTFAKETVDCIRENLKQEYFKILDKDYELENAMLTCNSEYNPMLLEDGLYSWSRFTVPDKYLDIKDILAEYLSDRGFILDAENDSILSYYGDDYIGIQEDTRHDNGVWQGHKLIIEESEYLDNSGSVNVKQRNQLIEQHMEETGIFPCVGIVTRYGEFQPVDTLFKD